MNRFNFFEQRVLHNKKRPTKRAGDSATPPEFIGGWRKTPSA